MEKKRGLRLSIIATVVLTMVFTTAIPAFAAAPEKEQVKYLGSGKVEVEFWDDVQYKNVKVTVKDTSGKKYKTSIYKMDDDELRFKIKKYKAGKKYKFTISGIRAEYTDSYGKVKGTVKIKKSNGKNISASKAKNIALKDAGLSASDVWGLEVEKEMDDGAPHYDVTFETGMYDYEYKISLKGKILYKDVERD